MAYLDRHVVGHIDGPEDERDDSQDGQLSIKPLQEFHGVFLALGCGVHLPLHVFSVTDTNHGNVFKKTHRIVN